MSDDELPWEEEARDELRDALRTAKADAERGVVEITIDGEVEFFDTFGDLTSALERFVERELEWRRPNEAEADWEGPTSEIVDEELENHATEELFDSLKPDFSNQLHLTFEHGPDASVSRIIRVDLEVINEELIRHLAKHPELLHTIDPFKFEDLVGELFRSRGYDVVATPRSRDGGFDFRAFHKDPTGMVCTLTLVECKRQRPDRKVTVGVVRRLRGVLDTNGAGNGIIVTTSTFTRGAKEEQKLTPYRLSLADGEALGAWLQAYRRQGPR